MGKKNIIFGIFVFFLLASLARADLISIPDLGIAETAKPLINVTVFSKGVAVDSAYILGKEGRKINVAQIYFYEDTQKNQTKYTYVPSEFLENWVTYNPTPYYYNYAFVFNARDSEGNAVNASPRFGINVEYMKISIIEPYLGMANHSPFNIIIETEYPSLGCVMGRATSLVNQNNLADVYAAADKELTPIDGSMQRWVWNGFNEVSEGQYIPYWFVCTYGSPTNYNFFSHELGYDTSPPEIRQININPNPVIDPLKRHTNITIISDDRTICKYQDLDTGEVYMADLYVENNKSYYKTTKSQQHSYVYIRSPFSRTKLDGVFEQYPGPFLFSYRVVCRNLAGLISTKDFSVIVNINTTIGLERATPEYISKNSVDFEVKTKISADCFGALGNSPAENELRAFLPVPGKINHYSLPLTGLITGNNKVYVRCSSQGSAEDKYFSLFVDTAPPTAPTIETGNFACSLEILEATISAEDNQSGIGYINYTVFDGSTMLFEWRKRAKDSFAVSTPSLDLKDQKEYTWKAFAVDRAGNVGSISTKKVKAINPLEKECDDVPPIIKLTIDQGDGYALVNLSCNDGGGVGCKDKYNYSFQNNANENCKYPLSKSIGSTLYIDQTTYFCYRVEDKNGNYAIGKQRIIVVSASSNITNQSDLPRCANNIKDGDETGVDCGGSCIKGCGAGEMCNYGSDCVSFNCQNNICQETNCNDGIKNGQETDIDCGGNCEAKCPIGKMCFYDADCADDLICSSGACKIPMNVDQDNDGLPDYWEYMHFGSRTGADPKQDPDRDGANNLKEYLAGTDPNDKNSKPETKSILPLIILILGILLIVCGGAYLFLAKQKVKEKNEVQIMLQNKIEQAKNPSLPQQERAEISSSSIYRKKSSEKKKKELAKLLSAFEEKEGLKNQDITPLEEVKIDKKKEEIIRKKQEERKKKAGKEIKTKTQKSNPGQEYIDITELKKQQELEKQDLKKKVFEKLEGISRTTKRKGTEITEEDEQPGKNHIEEKDKAEKVKGGLAKGDLPKSKLSNRAVFEKLAELSRQPRKKLDTMIGENEKLSTKKMMDIFANVTDKKQINQDVFKVILSELLAKGKITKSTVSEILLNFLDDGLLTKKEVDKIMEDLKIISWS